MCVQSLLVKNITTNHLRGVSNVWLPPNLTLSRETQTLHNQTLAASVREKVYVSLQ